MSEKSVGGNDIFLTAAKSRLDQYFFERDLDGGSTLALPELYARLFELRFPALIDRATQGFTPDREQPHLHYVVLPALTEREREEIDSFIGDFSRYLLLGLGRHLAERFCAELDFCLALDFNFTLEPGARSEIGELLYRAKYKRRRLARRRLVNQLLPAFRRLPFRSPPAGVVLSSPPIPQTKNFDLPYLLAKSLTRRLLKSGEQVEQVIARLRLPKPSMKDSRFQHKLDFWEKVMQPQHVELSGTPQGRTVCVVDDLYKSGCTLWSYARLLKQLGADQVLGLVAVKSISDGVTP
ncbi:MAG: hypothetical protein ABIJ61_10180 [bacterium]